MDDQVKYILKQLEKCKRLLEGLYSKNARIQILIQQLFRQVAITAYEVEEETKHK